MPQLARRVRPLGQQGMPWGGVPRQVRCKIYPRAAQALQSSGKVLSFGSVRTPSVKQPFRGTNAVVLLAVLVAGLLLAGEAGAAEADDLQRMIEQSRQSASDLERLDDHRSAREDVTLLRVWLDEAWRFRSEQNYDDVRVVLQRCDAQAEMIRQKIVAGKVSAQASDKAAAVKKARAAVAKTRQLLEQAKSDKIRLEARGK